MFIRDQFFEQGHIVFSVQWTDFVWDNCKDIKDDDDFVDNLYLLTLGA